MDPTILLQWWNLIFVGPFAIALLLTILQAVGNAFGDGVDSHSDHDINHDADHGIDLHTGDHDHHGAMGGVSRALSFMGIGKIPISLFLMCFCYIWGFTGWASNMFIHDVLPYPTLYVWLSLVIAGFASVFFTRHLARLIAKFLPRLETYGVSKSELAFLYGESRFQITETSGSALVYDKFGNMHDVSCRIFPGDQLVPSGARVYLMEYDSSKEVYMIISSEKLKQLIEAPGK